MIAVIGVMIGVMIAVMIAAGSRVGMTTFSLVDKTSILSKLLLLKMALFANSFLFLQH